MYSEFLSRVATSSPDPTYARLESLVPDARKRAAQLVSDARYAGIPLFISSSARSLQEQAGHVAAGRSAALNSKHLTGRAFDVDVWGYRREQLPKWFWDILGQHGESLGLRWGGRWTRPYDPGHFEV